MDKVYSHFDRFMVFQVKQLLDNKGIPCFVKNEFAIGAMGELSPMDVLPEVWISDPQWLPKAQLFVKQFEQEFESQTSTHTPWVCVKCNESNLANFELCWQCGTENAS